MNLRPRGWLIAFINSMLAITVVILCEDINDLLIINFIFPFYLVFLRICIERKVKFNFCYLFILSHLYYLNRELYYLLNFSFKFELLQSAQIISISSLIICSILCTNFIKHSNEIKQQKKLNVSNTEVVIIFLLFVFYLSQKVPVALSTLSIGRVATFEIFNNGILPYFLNALSYLLPVMFAVLYKKGFINKFTLFSLSMSIFILIIASGTRFVFLFSFVMFINALIDFRKIKVKQVSVLFIVLLASSTITMMTRGGGNNSASLDESVSSTENIVHYFSGLVKYYKINEHDYYPKYSIFSTYFFIPRSIWEDKPLMIGKWILHSGVYNETYTDAHSGSVSFIGPFYADFGEFFIFFPFVLGALLCRAEQFYLENQGMLNENSIIASTFIPTIFFGFRSFNTALITLIFIIFVIKAFFYLKRGNFQNA